ncbi:DNA topoisomerase [uncultured Dubosiella sp.]|uniref:DNA topoisomerase n=1 Tax=uncultured Dubosiella sp. TaxID=1937011 RepID=UPI00259379D7|nr:DNA topoisomerase [uncultured Dubosiella sp.]
MIGILTEKASAARNFEKALGGKEGTYNGEAYRITHARGHLYELYDPSQQVDEALQKKYKSWNTKNLPWKREDFLWKKKETKDAADILKQIKADLKGCDELIIATDDDPSGEGELLAWEIIDGLALKPKKISRMYFVDESKPSIQKAFVERKPLDQKMDRDLDFVKADFRSKWDYLSMQFTRIATANGDGKSVLRQGRLKSAMVKMVGDQLKKVESYKKEPFYELRFKDENGNMFIKSKAARFKTPEEVDIAIESSPVVVDSTTLKKTPPPRLLDLAGLSAQLSTQGLKAKTVLSTYQKMYEDQIVSYPRTEDKTITPEQFQELLPLADQIAQIVGVKPELLTYRKARASHVKAQGAHGANRPGPNVPKSLSDLKKYGAGAEKIYVLLAKNFLAMLAPNYEYEQQKGHLEKYPDYKATTDIPKFKGWKAVYNASDSSEEEEKTNKKLGTHADPFTYEGFPPKPVAPTMKWLMKQLAKYEVGTGATRTSIYADVTNANTRFPLLVETRGKLSMSEYGNISYQLLPGTNIGNLEMTEQLVKQMQKVGLGQADPNAFLDQMEQLVMQDLEQMKENGKKIVHKTYERNPDDYVKTTINGKEIEFKKEFSGTVFTPEQIEALKNGEVIEVQFKTKAGQEVKAKGKLEEQTFKKRKFYGFKPSEYFDLDGNPVKDETEYVECTWNGNPVKFKRVFGQHRFTDEEVEALVAGQQITTEFLSKKGKPFKAKGSLQEQVFRGHKFFGFKIEEFEKKPAKSKKASNEEA